ncbi:MAG: RsiV family protein [Candidatus Parcubacteria bacterium]|nr:RsiV family protein [Candidatus Parcubacteria bacterium]
MQKNLSLILIVCILVMLALFVAIKFNPKPIAVNIINNFDECAKSGNAILESYPRQCKTADGRSFTEVINLNNNVNSVPDGSCANKCGDGICQEIVCLTIGCPCAESGALCPEDCQNPNGVKYQSENIKEETADYSLDLEYPVITMVDKNKEIIINKKIKALIDNQILGFKKDMGKKEADMAASFMDSGYEFFLLNENFISLRLALVTYASGAAHPMNYSVTFNYEVDRDKEIFLDELFKPQPNYLPYLADYCQLDLKDKLGADLFSEGLMPEKTNFSLFVLTPESIVFLFDPYQVASYADGPQQSEVFYYQLTDVINDKGAIPRLAGQKNWENIINRY